MNYSEELQECITHLSSPKALAQFRANHYWPKWDGPWWQMLLLHEMGQTKLIPKVAIEQLIATLNKLPLKIFPLTADEVPEGVDFFRDIPCHCQLGAVYQVLSEWGIDVDQELPWIRPWFLKYQMADGGLNCDDTAYQVKDECPSSMVGTIAAFEAILMYTNRAWTNEEKLFLDKAANFLIARKLRLGSATKFNSGERESAKDWVKLCFPRFYFYDILRGLNALSIWAEKTKQALPQEATSEVIDLISKKFSEGSLRVERQAFKGTTSINQDADGKWIGGQPAGHFLLFDKVSRVGEVSPFLSDQWDAFTRRH